MISHRALLVAGLLAAVIISVAAVFFASSGPDGLESAALVVRGAKTLTGPAPQVTPGQESPGGPLFVPPFSGYSLGGGSGHIGSILAMVLGILLIFGAILGVGRLLTRAREKRERETP